MKTAYLFWEDDYLREMDATVLLASGDKIILDRTVFYPQGGGQECDTGYLIVGDQKFQVKDVRKEEEYIVHTVDGSADGIEPGTAVHGVIDWDRRYYLMKVHTSQHILSRAFLNLFSLYTTKASIAFVGGSIGLSHSPKPEEILKVQAEVNDLVSRNLRTRRLVGFQNTVTMYIGDYDTMGCGSTHVRQTSEIGHIKIYRVDGQNVYFEVGERAENVASKMADAALFASMHLGVTYGELAAKVGELSSALKSADEIFASYTNELVASRMAKGIQDSVNVGEAKVIFLPLEMIRVKELKNKVLRDVGRPGRVVVALTQNGTFSISSYAESIRADAIVSKLAEKFGVKGGGGKDYAQCGPINEATDSLFKTVLDTIREISEN